MYDREDLREGMTVRDSHGKRIGRVFAVGESEFQVEKGIFFPRDFVLRYGDIAEVQGREVLLRVSREEIPGWLGGYADKGYADRGRVLQTEPTPDQAVGAGATWMAGPPRAQGPSDTTTTPPPTYLGEQRAVDRVHEEEDSLVVSGVEREDHLVSAEETGDMPIHVVREEFSVRERLRTREEEEEEERRGPPEEGTPAHH